MNEKYVLNIDCDYILYAAGFIGESRILKAVHRTSGDEFEFKNRTEMYGRKRSKDGGWIGEQNALGKEYTINDFDLYDVQIPGELSHTLANVKSMILKASELSGVKKRELFVGKGESFRVDRSTILKYKSGRADALRPLYKEEIIEYMIKYHGAQVIEGIEVDDHITAMAWENPNNIIFGVDKDYYGTHSIVFNPNRPEEGFVDCRKFGELRIEEKVSPTTGKKSYEVKGYGRIWFYFQWCYGDDVDTYRANSATDKEWGEMSAYNMLKDCKTDAEAIAKVKETYQILYPSPTTVVGWRGSPIQIGWKYMASEIFDMARMRRHKGDNITAEDVFKKYNLWEG